MLGIGFPDRVQFFRQRQVIENAIADLLLVFCILRHARDESGRFGRWLRAAALLLLIRRMAEVSVESTELFFRRWLY